MQWFWIEPVDTLSFRGNRLFGDAGSFGESMMPPWPSVFAGAFRAAMLQWDTGLDLAAWKNGEAEHPVVGHWKNGQFTPGRLRLGPVFIGRQRQDGRVETCHLPPQDVLITAPEGQQQPSIVALRPHPLNASGLKGRMHGKKLPVAAQADRLKPQRGWLISQEGFERYLHGQQPSADQLVTQQDLWTTDIRTGIGLDDRTRSVEEGKLFTVQHMTPRPGVGFVVGLEGVDETFPQEGLLRLGGDGHSVRFHRLAHFTPPQVDERVLADAGRLRLVTVAPAILDGGWKPQHLQDPVCAAIQRAEVVSGWNLKDRLPKPARRAVGTGSVYWFEDIGPDQLRQQWQQALIRADEGFGQAVLAVG